MKKYKEYIDPEQKIVKFHESVDIITDSFSNDTGDGTAVDFEDDDTSGGPLIPEG